MLRRVLAPLLMALWLMNTSSSLALDAEANQAYDLKLVLHFAEHPLLSTPYFQEQVQRELRDNLQVALGDLAKVEVVRNHPLLKEVEAKGLEKALDGLKVLGNDKIHFVLIDFVDGDYEIQTRQYDELSGLASPVVRRRRTAERLLVARTAALMVDQDFGLVGTFTYSPGADKVQITLKGGGLSVPLEHWVKKDEVFAVALIVDQGSTGQRSVRAPWTLLQVLENPQNGVCSCQLLARFDPPFPEVPGVVGYRCLKLGTARAPLRLRLVTDKLGKPLSSKSVQISAHEIQPGDEFESKSTNPEGLVKSDRPYQHVAFVRVLEGSSKVLANIPVAILDERITSCELKDQKALKGEGQLQLRRDHWVVRLYESLAVSDTMARKLNEVVEKSHEEALEQAKKALDELNKDISILEKEGSTLQEAGKLSPGTTLKLEQGDQVLQELKARSQKLEEYIAKLQNSVNENPKIQNWLKLTEQARRLEDEAEYDQAIELYKRILAQSGENPELQKRLKKLQEDWKLKGEEHDKARKFIYRTWPKLETAASMKEKLDEAHKAFETCKKVGDLLSPRKLLKVNLAHGGKLNDELKTLGDNEDDRKTAKTILEVIDDLAKLSTEIETDLRNAKK